MHSRTPDDISIDTVSTRFAARAWGPKDGAPVLGLHGWLDNAATFDALAPLLPENIRLISLDLAGHGLSQHRSRDATYAMVDAVTDIAAIAQTLGWTRFTLMGHSMGAAIASLFAGTFPDTVERLVLLEGLSPMTGEADSAPERLAQAIADDVKKPASVTRVFASKEEAAQRVIAAAPMQRTSALTLLERSLAPVAGGWTWRTDPRLRGTTRLRMTSAHVDAFLQRICAPTLLVRAKDGFPMANDVWTLHVQKVRRLHQVEVEGQHHVHLDNAPLVASHVARFLLLRDGELP